MTRQSRVLTCAEWLFRRLLPMAPGAFRHAYGDEMVHLFRERCARARQRGRAAAARAVMTGLMDLVLQALRARVDGARETWASRRREPLRDLALAARRLSQTPVVTAVAIVSMGLGIGANTTVFSLFNQLLLQPLPVGAPEELVNIASPGPKHGSGSCGIAGSCDAIFSYPMYLDLSREQQVFTGVAAHTLLTANIASRGETATVDGLEVSGNYFEVLGLRAALGRLIAPTDTATIGATPVAVLAYDYWTTQFGADPAAVGGSFSVNGRPLTIVGIAPAGFDGTTLGDPARFFVPLTMSHLLDPSVSLEARDNYWAYLFARRRPGVSMASAEAGMNVRYHAILAQADPPLQTGLTAAGRAAFSARRLVLDDGRRGQSLLLTRAETPLITLQVVSGIVLLMACANIANLLLARAAGRAGEMAVRLSIGATRGQLVRQLLTESCLLSALGGLLALGVLRLTTHLIVANAPLGAVDPAVTTFSLRVLVFAAGMSIGTGLLFGLAPAWFATRPDVTATLKGHAGPPTSARTASRFRTMLVVGQLALSMGLLACAGMFTKSLVNLSRVDLGLQIDHVATFGLSPLRNGYTTIRAQQLFADALVRLAALPGVTSVAAARVPLMGGFWSQNISLEDYTPATGETMTVNANAITPKYFRTVGIPIMAGRDFTEHDVPTGPEVAIVNRAFTRRFRLGAAPIGRRLRLGEDATRPFDLEIVGVVADAAYTNVRDAVPPVLFLADRQQAPATAMTFYALSAGDPATLLGAVRRLLTSLDPSLPVERLATLPQQVSDTLSAQRLVSVLSAAFAGLATALAAMGLYGVLAYTVSQRTREFGVRMALGASPSAVRRLVLRHVLWMTAIGGAVGLALAMGVGQLARTLLYHVTGADPGVLIASAGALGAVAFAAGLLPSLRASRVDPMRALRCE